MTQLIIPSRLQDLLSKMDFYGQQRSDNKVCVKTRMYVDVNTWYGWFYRRVHGESKQDLVADLKALMLEFYKCWEDNPVHHVLMVRYLDRMRHGLVHLIAIYANFAGVVADITIILESIDIYRVTQASVSKINSLHEGGALSGEEATNGNFVACGTHEHACKPLGRLSFSSSSSL